MDILELLMKNWWLLLALLWFFSGAIGKKGKQRREQQREPQSTPQSAETPIDESRLMEQYPYTRQAPGEFIANSTKKAVEHVKNNQLVRQDIGEEIGQGTIVKSPNVGSYSKEASNQLDFKTIDKSKVVQGIIWSQIFGKPRAKEPHRATMYSRSGKR